MGSGVPSGNLVKPGLTASIVVTCTLSGSVSVRIFVAQRSAGGMVASITCGGGVPPAGIVRSRDDDAARRSKRDNRRPRFGAVPSMV